MSFVSRWVKRFKPLEIEDGFFGHLVYVKATSTKFPYWVAWRHFSPCSSEIKLFIDAPGPGLPPNEGQRAFYDWVEQDYKLIFAKVEIALPPVFEPLMQEQSMLVPFSKVFAAPFSTAFHLTSFSMPAPQDGMEPEWEMSFESNSKPDFLVQVDLIGANPQPDIFVDFVDHAPARF